MDPDDKKLAKMSKVELIDTALLKHVSGGNACGYIKDICGEDAGTNCWHDQCYEWTDTCNVPFTDPE